MRVIKYFFFTNIICIILLALASANAFADAKITAIAESGGSITQVGTMLYTAGETPTYTVTPDSGYRIL